MPSFGSRGFEKGRDGASAPSSLGCSGGSPKQPSVELTRTSNDEGPLGPCGLLWNASAYARPSEMASGEVHRTQLAHERTYLAWWRTGLAAIAAGFAVGRVLPEVVGGTNWPYIALGTVLTASGLAAMVYGIVHYRELEAALREDRAPHIGEGFVLALAAVGSWGSRVRPARPPRSLSAASPRANSSAPSSLGCSGGSPR